MATWKRFTGAVDSSAQSFLNNKRFSRERKKFTWDWHAWNLAFVSAPSVLLAYYLDGVEKRMREEAAIREDIQERTGISSRGFLIPKKERREEVLGMLSAGNQPRVAGGKDVGKEQRKDEGHSQGGNTPTDFESIQRRLATIERVLGMQSNSSSAATGAGVDDGSGPSTDSMLSSASGSNQREEINGKGNATSKADNSSAEGTVVGKAKATASAAGSWVLEAGERHGRRLLQISRDWLAGENQQGGLTPLEKSEMRDNPVTNNPEADRQGELPAVSAAGKASESVGKSPSSIHEGSAPTASDSRGIPGGAGRRGSPDENDKQI